MHVQGTVTKCVAGTMAKQTRTQFKASNALLWCFSKRHENANRCTFDEALDAPAEETVPLRQSYLNY